MNYDVNDFNDDGVLTPGIFLIIATAYLSRFLLFGPISLLASKNWLTGASYNTDFLTDATPLEMISSLPAVYILYAIIRRTGSSPDFMRTVWAQGRWVLLGTVIFHLMLQAYSVISTGEFSALETSLIAINGYLVYYLAFTPRVKDVFSMFPEADQPD